MDVSIMSMSKTSTTISRVKGGNDETFNDVHDQEEDENFCIQSLFGFAEPAVEHQKE